MLLLKSRRNPPKTNTSLDDQLGGACAKLGPQLVASARMAMMTCLNPRPRPLTVRRGDGDIDRQGRILVPSMRAWPRPPGTDRAVNSAKYRMVTVLA